MMTLMSGPCPWRRPIGPSGASSNVPSSFSQRLQVDSPMRTTLMPLPHEGDVFFKSSGLQVGWHDSVVVGRGAVRLVAGAGGGDLRRIPTTASEHAKRRE